MDYMLMPLRRYADFQGRSRRKEYWMYVLFQVILFSVLGLLAVMAGAFDSDGNLTGAGSVVIGLFAIVGLGLVIPGLAVQLRRFHDQDRSGWFVLLSLIPYVGSLIVLVFMCLGGTKGPNRFGPDPKGAGEDFGEVFS